MGVEDSVGGGGGRGFTLAFAKCPGYENENNGVNVILPGPAYYASWSAATHLGDIT